MRHPVSIRFPLAGEGAKAKPERRGVAANPPPGQLSFASLSDLPHKGGGEERISRSAIVEAARSWIGTPYHHQASLKGVGCDCLGLIRGLWRELVGPEPERLPPYSRDWGDATGSEPLLKAGLRHLIPLSVSEALPGDVIVFRMQAGVAKHAGVLVEGALRPQGAARFVHAQEGLGVTEAAMTLWWRRRAAAVFQFPGVA